MAQFESIQVSSFTDIVVSFQFESFHYWPGAPSPHTYLSNPHRHMFHVKAYKEVSHGNREIEIIQFKRVLQCFAIEQWGHGQNTTLSCEQMAEALCNKFDLSCCEVLEDGENGACFYNKQQTSVVHTISGSKVSFQDVAFAPEPTEPKRPPFGSIFLGRECEGPKHLRGRPTLFIPASRCKLVDIDDWRHVDTRKMGIYLGAGGDIIKDSTFLHLLKTIIREFPFVCLLLEVRCCADLSAGIEKELVPIRGKTGIISHTFSDIQNEYATYYKKVKDGVIYWIDQYGDIHTTSVNDPKFSKDEVV